MPDAINWSLALPYLLAALGSGYLIGSIPFGLLISRAAGAGDIRAIGSGNIGATNVLRTGRKSLAAATLAADVLKGAIPVLIAWNWGPDIAISAGFGAFVGHLWPVWLKFRGGKGVATFAGVLAGLYWPAALGFAAVWIAVAFVSRYSSLAALLACAAAPGVLALADEPQLVEVFGLMAVIVFFTHRANIARLLRGAESRISLHSDDGSP